MFMNRWWKFVQRAVPPEVIALLRLFKEHGFTAYIVGGALRDLLLGQIPADWDLATDALPETVEEICATHSAEGLKIIQVGKKFGVISFSRALWTLRSLLFVRRGRILTANRIGWISGQGLKRTFPDGILP